MNEKIIKLLQDIDNWKLSGAERKRLADYLESVRRTLQEAKDRGRNISRCTHDDRV